MQATIAIVRRLVGLVVLVSACKSGVPSEPPATGDQPLAIAPEAESEAWLPEPTPEEMAAVEPTLEDKMAEFEPLVLQRPPFSYTLVRALDVQPGPQPKLEKRAQAKNQITDEDQWFERHGLSVPVVRAAWRRSRRQPLELPDWAPPEWKGVPLIRAIDGAEGAILFYGNQFESEYLVVLDAKKENPRSIFSFRNWAMPPRYVQADAPFVEMRPTWAEIRGDVLYVSHDHRTYAKSSKGSNAYVSAIDVNTGALLWRSAPLVSNTRNFLIRDGYILTGYGFTAEKDFLVMLDQSTGKEVWRKKIVSGPDWLLEKDGVLYVRTYNTDYEFTLR